MARIVIVDDTAMMRNQLRYIFEQRGDIVVAEAENGKDAIFAYKQYLPDLMTMDINMPVMTGIEAVKAVITEFPDAKIVMISSESERDLLIRAVKNGATHYILKPFEEAKVLQVVNHLLGSNKPAVTVPVRPKASSSSRLPHTSMRSASLPPKQDAAVPSKKSVNEYLVGKVVTENVYNKQGKLLLRSGKTVTVSMVELLRKNNILQVKAE